MGFFANIQGRPTPTLYESGIGATPGPVPLGDFPARARVDYRFHAFTLTDMATQGVILSADQHFSSITKGNITGFLFTLKPSTKYIFGCALGVASSVSTGIAIKLGGTVNPTVFRWCTAGFNATQVLFSTAPDTITVDVGATAVLSNIMTNGGLITDATANPTFLMQCGLNASSGHDAIIGDGSSFWVTEIP